MLKRTVYFGNPYHLKIRDRQLIATAQEDSSEKKIPVEDLGFVILDHPQITVTLPLMEALNAGNVAVIFCNSKHMPVSMSLNLDGHHLQNELFRHQLRASEPLKKNLWQQTVVAKIRNQAALLRKRGENPLQLERLTGKVRSGDPTNREGAAARVYWPRLFGVHFLREREGPSPNNMLNYGYAVLRAAVARALTGSGLLATTGIHHHNRYNAFCLADDIMEPYRPYVDEAVAFLYLDKEIREDKLSLETRAQLLQILSRDVIINHMKRPLMVALSQTTASLARCFAGETRKILYPQLE